MATEQHQISLPSLIHRVGREQVDCMRVIATQHACEVKRVRRSRNWQAEGSYRDLQALNAALTQLDSLKFHFVINKLTLGLAAIEPPRTIEQQLADLLQDNPNITLSELVSVTGCEISQARQARFYSESL